MTNSPFVNSYLLSVLLGTFSEYEWFNDIIGHICHASILVPFYPWQLSHRRHHMFHNHVEKDYSHPWYLPERLLREDEGLARLMDKYSFIRVIFPFVGWPIYIFLGTYLVLSLSVTSSLKVYYFTRYARR